MTLDSWAAIAEIIGAIAVIVTLMYLAIQVRHSKESVDANTKAIRAQAISDITRNVHDQMHMLVQGHDTAAAFQRFATEDSLEPLDAFLIDSVLSAVFVARQNEYFQWKQGLIGEEVFRSLHHIILTILGSPNGRHWWQNEGRRMYAPAFVDFVDAMSKDVSPESFESWKRPSASMKIHQSMRHETTGVEPLQTLGPSQNPGCPFVVESGKDR